MHPIERLLDELRLALLVGDYPQAAALAPRIDVALTALRAGEDAAVLRRISARAEGNARLITAARRGMAAARRRLDDIARAGRLRTYGVDGRPAEIGPHGTIAGRF